MKSAFDYWIARDPMRVTDEYIFGVWSKERNDWDSKGVFDYDKYSKGLSKVIEAVKVNNYTLAKDELLAYYRKSDKKNKIKPNPKSIEHCLMSYEALKRNIYSVCKMNGMVMGFFNAEEELDWHSIDVKRSIKSLVLGSNAMVSYHLVSVDKTEVFAEFYSRKSEFVPYLELVVNGMPVKVNCFKDTMVRGGDKSSVNYSSEQVFKVRESGCYHNHDANMHRAYFVFDVNFLKPDDVVESATLNVYGKSQKGTKEICVYNEFEAGWKEDTFCWDNVTDELIFSCSDMNTWDFITSSATVIKGKICFYHRADELSVIAHLYKVSKNEEHAYTFLRNAMGLVHHVGCSREVFNELDMARYTENLPRDIFNTIDSEHMTGERFVALFKNVYTITK
ncbi:MAG: DNRLRE domain-containing protein, partial [Clostridia bacterium]|nr:DNRLRE domain-containing protein [Clostridia bacterium]